MRKAVGQFEVKVDGPSPCRIEINDATGGAIKLDSGDLRDLEHAVLCAIRQVEDLRVGAMGSGQAQRSTQRLFETAG